MGRGVGGGGGGGDTEVVGRPGVSGGLGGEGEYRPGGKMGRGRRVSSGRGCRLEALGQPGEKRAAQPELRIADADPRAVADLVDLVEQIEDVKAQFEPFVNPGIDRLDDAEIDLLELGRLFPLGTGPLVARRPLPAIRSAENKVRVEGTLYLMPAE